MNKKNLIITIAVVCVMVIAYGAYKFVNYDHDKWLDELKMAYYTQNMAFPTIVNVSLDNCYKYLPVNLSIPQVNDIDNLKYLNLAFYKKTTGKSLTYDQIIEYLSEEYEDDGEVRIYINGRHPAIADHIEWSKQSVKEWSAYRNLVNNIFETYCDENKEFARCALNLVPVEMLDELIKSEADPRYEMDLLSIQNRYIAAGRAKLSEDGKDIEYSVTTESRSLQ